MDKAPFVGAGVGAGDGLLVGDGVVGERVGGNVGAGVGATAGVHHISVLANSNPNKAKHERYERSK